MKGGDAKKVGGVDIDENNSPDNIEETVADVESPKSSTVVEEESPIKAKQEERKISPKSLQKAFSYYDIKVVCLFCFFINPAGKNNKK